jgi:hypothetical protein
MQAASPNNRILRIFMMQKKGFYRLPAQLEPKTGFLLAEIRRSAHKRNRACPHP